MDKSIAHCDDGSNSGVWHGLPAAAIIIGNLLVQPVQVLRDE
jgi:hypothetical protein